MAKKAKRASKGKQDHVVEIEQKFDVPTDFVLPELIDLPGVAAVDDPVVHQLEATYLDTEGLDLLTHKWILRRRTGGSDAGWHLKRPLPDGERDEMQFPVGRSSKTIPVAVQRAVAVHARGRALVPIARLSTTRTVRALRDRQGEVLAEVMLDAVDAASLHADGQVRDASTWFEMEIELGTGDRALLRALDERVRSAGAWPSPSVSKLAQAMQERLAVEPLGRIAPPSRYGPSTAVGVVLAYLAGEVGHLQANDPLVRIDADDAVHQMRVASRRLRSALATFRPLFDRSITDPIRTELQWIGTELGSARDVEVIRDHLIAAVAAEPAALQHGPVVRRIRSTMAARYKQAHTHGVAQLGSERYYALLDSLDALVADPPLAPDAGTLPVEHLTKLVRRTWRTIDALHDELDRTDDRYERDVHLHEVRKAAKRARYAGEALSPTFGAAASGFASAMAAIQGALGDHQDSVVIREELIALAAAAEEADESTFTYGRLHALEQVRGAETEEAFAAAWKKASDRSVLRWLGA